MEGARGIEPRLSGPTSQICLQSTPSSQFSKEHPLPDFLSEAPRASARGILAKASDASGTTVEMTYSKWGNPIWIAKASLAVQLPAEQVEAPW